MQNSSLFQEKVDYLGFDVSRHGVQPSPEKVRTVVVEWPQPQSVKDVCNFLGLEGFYKRFICNFNLKAGPLENLTKDGIRWQWIETEKKTF